MTKKIIAWDLGGTKCTAGIILLDEKTQALTCEKHYSVKLATAHSLPNLIELLEAGLDFSMNQADAICIGGAGHYDGETLHLEKAYPFVMSFAKIAAEQKWPPYTVIHDYAPIVCATFTSYMDKPDNVKHLNACALPQHGRRVALGVGTGLGLKDGVLLPNGDFWLGKNEIGHIGIPTPPSVEKPILARHKELMRFLKEETDLKHDQPVTFEKLLSGSGTTRLYQFFYPSPDNITPEEVGLKMHEGNAGELLDTFAWYLGLFVGTVQLAFMPEGGIWITGGVAMNHLALFERPDFFAGIHASPGYLAQRQEYPLGVLCNHEHALFGGGYYAAKKLIVNA